MNIAPLENFQAGTLPDEGQELSVTTNPLFGQTLDLGLFDIETLPTTPENEFTTSLDGNQFSQDGFSSREAMFAFAPDGDENLWN